MTIDRLSPKTTLGVHWSLTHILDDKDQEILKITIN